MASIIPFDQVTVGAGTVTLLSTTFFPASFVANPPAVHKIYIQATNGNTGVVTVKLAGKVIFVLFTPAASGPLPEHHLLGDDNMQNNLVLNGITLTGTNSGDKVQGYLVIC